MSKCMHFISAIFLTAMSFCQPGCGTSTTVVSEKKYSPVPVGHVEVLYQEPKRSYDVVALVHAGRTWGMSGKKDVASLKEQAAQVGADAVLITSVHGVTLTQYDNAEGKAIKWRN